MTQTNRFVLAPVLCLVLALSAQSRADDTSAERLLRQGFAELQKGHAAAAYRICQKAVAQSRTPKALGILGQAAQALSRYEEAEAAWVWPPWRPGQRSSPWTAARPVTPSPGHCVARRS